MLCKNCKEPINTRTLLQNNSLHKYFEMLAEALNEAGFDMKEVIRVDIPWTPENVKKFLWKPLQKVYLGHDKTSGLKTGEVSKVYDILNRVIAERCNGLHVPFPSIDNLIEREYEDKSNG